MFFLSELKGTKASHCTIRYYLVLNINRRDTKIVLKFGYIHKNQIEES